jgi:subtilisin family serine protease
MNEEFIYFHGSFCEIRPPKLVEKLGQATGKNVKIGVLDSGWDRSLVDSRINKGVGLTSPRDELSLEFSEDDNDQNGHGTSCSELILRIAPDSELYPIKVFGEEIETSIDIIVEGIKWGIQYNMKILNLSLGTILPAALAPLYNICEIARRKGMIIISSKSNTEEWSYPAIFENAIGVELGTFENIFDFEFKIEEAIECKAKGFYNDLLMLKGYRVPSGGNSCATPVITGLIALIIEKNPTYNLDDIRNYLHDNLNTKIS